MGKSETKVWWDKLPAHIGGDVIIGEVGANATGVAIGKNITQRTIAGVLGEPTPDDKEVIEQRIAGIRATLQSIQGQLDPAIANSTEFQIGLLEGELTKTEANETPSGNVIARVGDWLLDNLPQMAEEIAGLFATPAVGKVIGKAGEATIGWIKRRFGGDR